MKKLIGFVILIFILMLSGCSQEIYTVSFDTIGGDHIDSVLVHHGDKIPNPSVPYKEGYTFNGWSYNGVPWNLKTDRVKSDMTLRAIFSANIYKITFDSDGGSLVKPISEEYDHRVTLPETTKEGFAYAGWDYNNKIVKVLDVPATNLTLKVVWDIDYTVWYVWRNELRAYKGDFEKIYLPAYYLLDFNKVNIDIIKNGCFSSNLKIKEVIIPEGIKTIDNSAFFGCSSLEKVTLPNTLESIGSFAFYMSNIKEIVIPSSVTKINVYAFYNTNSSTKIFLEHDTIPSEWVDGWYVGDVEVYLKHEWTYDSNGNPVVI